MQRRSFLGWCFTLPFALLGLNKAKTLGDENIAIVKKSFYVVGFQVFPKYIYMSVYGNPGGKFIHEHLNDETKILCMHISSGHTVLAWVDNCGCVYFHQDKVHEKFEDSLNEFNLVNNYAQEFFKSINIRHQPLYYVETLRQISEDIGDSV